MSNHKELFTELIEFIKKINPKTISEERKKVLQPLINYIQSKVSSNQEIRINFICTHNSRRSHMSQIWAQTLASFFKINNVNCYSGGTEATALFPMVLDTLEKSGFKIKRFSEGNNPIFNIKYSDNSHPILGFSKRFDDAFNPTSNFAAVMTCSQADEDCPFIGGAEVRIPITYEDPKLFDNTEHQSQKYNERSIQIATELFYVFSQINS